MTERELKEYLKRSLTIEGRIFKSMYLGKILRIVVSLEDDKIASADIKMD